MGMTGEQAYVLAKKLIEADGGGGGTVDAYTKTQTDNLLFNKADKGTTLANYGITDGATKKEVSELKEDLVELGNSFNLQNYSFVQGSINLQGSDVDNSLRIRTDYIKLEKGVTYKIKPNDGYKFFIWFYDENKSIMYNGFEDWISEEYSFASLYDYARFQIATVDDSLIIPSDKSNVCFYKEMYYHDKFRIETNIDRENYYYKSYRGTSYPPNSMGDSSRTRVAIAPFTIRKNTLIKVNNDNYKYALYGEIFGYVEASQRDYLIKEEQIVYVCIFRTDNSTIDNSEIVNLFNALNFIENYKKVITDETSISRHDFCVGSLNGVTYPYSENNSSNMRLRSCEYWVNTGTKISCSNDYDIVLCGEKKYVSWSKAIEIDTAQKCRFLIRKTDNSVITDNEIETIVNSLSIDYWSTESLSASFSADYDNEIEKTRANITDSYSSDRISYVMITDLHIDQETKQVESTERQLKALVEIVNTSDIDFVVCGGDLIMGISTTNREATKLIRKVTNILSKSTKPVFIVKGNHDYNSFNGKTDEKIVTYNQWFGNAIGTQKSLGEYDSNNNSSTYFYYDIPNKNTRVIFLDTSDWKDNYNKGEQSYLGFSSEQLSWLKNEALNDANRDYIIFGHSPIIYEYNCWDYMPENYETVLSIITALNNRTSFDGKDFSNYHGNIKLYHYGHVHADLMVIDNDTNTMQVCTRCACCYSNHQYTKEELHISSDKYVMPNIGTYGTVSECAFDVMSVTNNKVVAYRFGNGNDRELSF